MNMRAQEHKKLDMILRGLAGRVEEREDLQSLTVLWGEAPSPQVEVRWVPEEGRLVWFQEGSAKRHISVDALPGEILNLVSSRGSFEILISERGHTLAVSYARGKLSTRISPKEEPGAQAHPASDGTRELFIQSQAASELLKAMGIMGSEERVPRDKRRKLFQVDRFVELVDQLIRDWPRDRELVVADLGAGKSLLSFALNYYLTEIRRNRCFITSVDSDSKVLESASRIRDRLGYRNMEFIHSRILDYFPSRKPDLVLSLHACDTATDEALALAVREEASFILAVPCCQAALSGEIDFGDLEPVARHGIFQRRLSDIITDGLRLLSLEARGYQVSVVEYVSPLDTPKNLMLRARRQGSPRPDRIREYRRLTDRLGTRSWVDRILEGEDPGKRVCHSEGSSR